MKISKSDQALIDAATNVIKENYKYGRHHVGVALRTNLGNVITAVNVDTYIGRAGVCAEAIAIGKLATEKDSSFGEIVAVYLPNQEFGKQEPYVASPCGVCREMINDYSPNAHVIYMKDSKVTKALASELLPGKFSKKHMQR